MRRRIFHAWRRLHGWTLTDDAADVAWSLACGGVLGMYMAYELVCVLGR